MELARSVHSQPRQRWTPPPKTLQHNRDPDSSVSRCLTRLPSAVLSKQSDKRGRDGPHSWEGRAAPITARLCATFLGPDDLLPTSARAWPGGFNGRCANPTQFTASGRLDGARRFDCGPMQLHDWDV